MKMIALLKEIATLQLGNVHDPKNQTPQHVCEGIIKSRYDEKTQEDITKLVLNASIIPIKGFEWDSPIDIINISDPDQEYDDKTPNYSII